MSNQLRGCCGHKKALWDTHPRCLSCSDCSRFSTCEFCKLWTSINWDVAESRRSYRKRVNSQLSSSTFSAEEMKHKKAHSRDKKKQSTSVQSPSRQLGRETDNPEVLSGAHSPSVESGSPRPSLVRATALSLRDASISRAPARSIRDAREFSTRHQGTISGAVEPPGSLAISDRSRSVIRSSRASVKSQSGLSTMGVPGPGDQTVEDCHHRASTSGLPGSTGQPGSTGLSGIGQPNSGQPGIGQPSSVQPHTDQPGARFQIAIPGLDTRNPVTSGLQVTGQPFTGNQVVSEQQEFTQVSTGNQLVAGHCLPGQLNSGKTTGHMNTNQSSRPGISHTNTGHNTYARSQHSLSRGYTSRHNVTKHKKRKYSSRSRRSSSSSSVSSRSARRRHSKKKKRRRRRSPSSSSSSSSDSSVSPDRNSRSDNRRQTSSVARSVRHDQEQVIHTHLPVSVSNEQFIHTSGNFPPDVRGSASLPLERTPRALSIDAADSVASYLENNPEQTVALSPDKVDDDPEDHRETWSFDKAINEVFRLLPSDMCPQEPDDNIPVKPLSGIERLSGVTKTSRLSMLPQSLAVKETLKTFQTEFEKKSPASQWSAPTSFLTSIAPIKYYKSHTPDFPPTNPKLDRDAGKLSLTSPTNSSLTTTRLESWERRCRELVSIASHADLFSSAAYQNLRQETLSPQALQRLLEAVGKTTRHSIALAMSLATEMLISRRDAVLSTSSVLLDHSKAKLRTAPLNGTSLFGGRIADVAQTDLTDQQHRLMAGVSSKKPAIKNQGSVPISNSSKPKNRNQRSKKRQFNVAKDTPNLGTTFTKGPFVPKKGSGKAPFPSRKGASQGRKQ